MTFTSHWHDIPGTPIEETVNLPLNCGGPGICEVCTFDMRWYKDRDAKRAELFPSETKGLSLTSQVLRNVSDKLRSQNPKPNKPILAREHVFYRIIFSLASAIDGVANDTKGL